MSDMNEVTEGQLLSESFGVGGPPAKARSLAVIEAELDLLKQDTRQKETGLLCNYIEVGRRLEEAKAQLPHGQWGDWLKKMDIAQSTANNFMRLFREYGAEQQSLFGAEAKSHTFGNLTYSKALKLLTITDEDERERFAAENDVEHMSVRELNEALKARNEAEEKAAAEDEARKLRQETERLQEQLAGQTQVYEAKLTSAGVEADQARAAEKAAQEALEKQRDKAQRLQNALSEANTATQAAENEHKRLLQELEELRSRPVDVAVAEPDPAEIEKARVEARQEALREFQHESLKEHDKVLAEGARANKAEADLAKAQKEKEDLRFELDQAEKKLTASDPNVAEFKVRFTAWQEEYGKMMEVLARVEAESKDRADKLRRAVKAALEQMT